MAVPTMRSARATERILGRLGPPRWLWIAIWASTAIVAPIMLLAILAFLGESARVTSVSGLVISQAVLAYAVALCLWGVGRLNRDARALEPLLIRLTNSDRPPYPVVGGLGGPILLTAAISIVSASSSSFHYGPLPTIAILPLLAIGLLPLMTFVWSYLQLLIGLDRLGRARLALDLFPQDRSLGLSAVGSVAFTGFVIGFAAVIPIFITTSANLTTVSVSLSIVGVIVVMFFLSMWRIHRQMAAAKETYVAEMRALYAEAYAPIRAAATVDELASKPTRVAETLVLYAVADAPLRAAPTVEALTSQATALGAAQSLVDRAERILEWPVDEGMTAWVAIIVTGVVTSLVVRVVFSAAGL